MKRLPLLVICGLLAASSCSKSNDATPVTPSSAKPCRVSKLKVTVAPTGAATTSTTYTFTYNSDDLLTKEVWTSSSSSGTATYTYTYKSGEISSVTDGTHTYIWTQQNGVVKTIDTKVFTYDGSGKLTKWTDTTPSNNHLSVTYTYTGSNLATLHFTMDLSSPIDATTTYAGYDNKTNPFTLLAEATSQPVYHWLDGGVEDRFIWNNNPGSSSTTGTQTGSFTYTYEYNLKGYPIKITQSGTSIVVTYEFEYINCDLAI